MGGAQPITLTEIQAYCWLYRVESVEERDKLIRFVHAMDNTYAEIQAKLAATNTKSEAPQNANSPG